MKDDTTMTLRSLLAKMTDHEGLNFVLTNYVPRRTLTTLAGHIAKIEQPLIRDISIAVWRQFSDLDLSEAKKSSFTSLHDCFIRELKDGARPVDRRPELLVSPSDGIVGTSGQIADGVMLQVKGSIYPLAELVRDEQLLAAYRNGTYVTLRLTASMYHRFHAPHDCTVTNLSHIAGDTWNVNPPALKRVPRLFCRNERAVVQLTLAEGLHRVTLVPVAAIAVACIRLNFAELPRDRQHAGPWSTLCSAPFSKGQEMGWFEHGSTIIVLAPPGFAPCHGISNGYTVRMGEPLLRLPAG